MSLIVAILTMASSSLLGGGEGVSFNAIAFAMISFPAFWAAMFFYALLEERPIRAIIVTLAIIVVNAAALYSAFMT